jgi:ADP-ribose pyrophosphatase
VSETGSNSAPLETRIVGTQLIYTGRAFDFVELTIVDRRGVARPRPIVRHRGAVVILPLLEGPGGSEVVLVRNERHTINGWLEELPAGGIDAGEEPEAAARRELREETGYEAATLRCLGRFYTTPGITDELMHVYLATGLAFVGQRLEDYEVLTTHRRTAEALVEAVRRGEVLDGKTIVAVGMARDAGLL